MQDKLPEEGKPTKKEIHTEMNRRAQNIKTKRRKQNKFHLPR